ncbi:hypothetical protein GCM10025873_26010 [Demequina sediminis]|nr:hypothetical protein GCM10025873_26010 [Demequina sediminis]
MHPLRHAAQAVAPTRARRVGDHAAAVVLDDDRHAVRLTLDAHHGARAGARVLHRIGERLLHHAIRAEFDPGGHV